MKILLSNDDGIHANGINVLAQTLAEEHEIYIIAPDKERSAASHALTINDPLRYYEHEPNGYKRRYSTTGTPADCIKLGLNVILSEEEKPDLIISGINHGPNMGYDILYSGTVGCAMEGGLFGVPSIALSLFSKERRFEKENFVFAAKFAKDFIKKLKGYKFPPKTMININIPSTADEKTEMAFTRVGNAVFADFYDKKLDPKGRTYYWLAGKMIEQTPEKGTDIEAVKNNLISVTTVTYEPDKIDYIHELEKSILSCDMIAK